jgi:NADP-dependent 3-hydroxy acid dehydrogenase YdfG
VTELKQGDIAVITGGASGIGLALGKAFAHRGMNVVLADLRSEALSVAGDQIREIGGNVLEVVTDVTDPDAVERLAHATVERFGHYDILCNNAGMFNGKIPLWEKSLTDWRKIVDVNIWGVIYGLTSFLPGLVKQGHGHVLNTASMAGLSTVLGNADYGMTKHAVVAITETLRADLEAAESLVGATVLCPGLVRTPLGMKGHRQQAASSGPSKFGASDAASDRMPDDLILEADDVAARTVVGIEANRLYVIPSARSEKRIRARFERVYRDLEASAADAKSATK